jgi:hypothetical protein
MSGDDYMGCNANAEWITSNGVTITSTGFSVGSLVQINHSGSDFWWMAFKSTPAIDTGTYTGAGTGFNAIALGRQPDAVFVVDPVSEDMYWKPNGALTGADTYAYTSSMTGTSTGITLTSTGFTAGLSIDVSGRTYYYMAMYGVVGSTQHCEYGTYSGTSTSHTITLGFQPTYVFIFHSSESGWKMDTNAGGAFGYLTNDYDYETAGLTIISTGFTLAGSDLNDSGRTYSYMAGRY